MAEVQMIERVFDLDDVIVREVMVPHPDVVSVSSECPLSDLRSIILDAEHTRYPVVEPDNGEQVVGFVDVKDVLRAIESDEGDTATAGDLSREILVVPETTTIDDLLLQFRDERQQMAAVIDEWGSFEGLATVEDVVEAIVGDLRDEFDVDQREPSIRRRDGGGYDVDGGVPLAILNDSLDTDFESEEFETVGGMVLERLDRAPEPGDQIEAAGYPIEVTSVDGARISTVRIGPRADDGEQTN
jgi:CBS domain containing-hemolysin-like protein